MHKKRICELNGRAPAWAVLTGTVVTCFAAFAGAQIQAETIVLTGNTGSFGPILGPGVSFSTISYLKSTNERGSVLFHGTLAGPGVTAANQEGLFVSYVAQAARLVVRLGDEAPGTGGAHFAQFGKWSLDNAGNIALTARLDTGTDGDSWGVWSGPSSPAGGLQLRLRGGSSFPLPGFPNAVVSMDSNSHLGVNPAGRVVLRGQVRYDAIGSTCDAVWAGTLNGPLLPVASQRMDVPGLPSGQRLSGIGVPWINSQGSVLFAATRNGAGANNFESLLLAQGGSVSLVAGENALDGLRGFDTPVIGDDGTLLAGARWGAASGTGTPDAWLKRPDTPALRIALPGQPAAECPPALRYDSGNAGYVYVGAGGDAVYSSRLSDGSNAHFITMPQSGAVRKIVRTGEALPGMPVGTSFTNVHLAGVDGHGRTLLVGQLSDGPGVPSGSSFWVWDPDTGLQALPGRGSTMACGDGMTRTIASLAHMWTDKQLISIATDGYVVLGVTFEADLPENTVRGIVRFHVSRPCGPADVGAIGGVSGHDGVLDNNDFVVFIDRFFAGDARADYGVQGGQPGQDGVFNNNDFIVFVDLFFSGCQV